MQERLVLFEDIVVDKFSEENHEKLYLKLQQLYQRGQIKKFKVHVPCSNNPNVRLYQFYLTISDDTYAVILKYFYDSQTFFREVLGVV